jgi:hypothetical protein
MSTGASTIEGMTLGTGDEARIFMTVVQVLVGYQCRNYREQAVVKSSTTRSPAVNLPKRTKVNNRGKCRSFTRILPLFRTTTKFTSRTP